MWFGATSRVLLEPPGGQAVEHLPLEGDGPEHAVEGADPVGDDDEAASVAASCSCRGPCPRILRRGQEVGAVEAERQGGAEGSPDHHPQLAATSPLPSLGAPTTQPRETIASEPFSKKVRNGDAPRPTDLRGEGGGQAMAGVPRTRRPCEPSPAGRDGSKKDGQQ